MLFAGIMVGWLIFVFFVFPKWIGDSWAQVVRAYREGLRRSDR